MKKFLAFMVCLIMLCAGTAYASEIKAGDELNIEQSCIDVGKVQCVYNIQFLTVFNIGHEMGTDYQYVAYSISDAGQMESDNILRKRTSDSYIDQLNKYALCSRNRLSHNYSLSFTGKHKVKYINHYTYAPSYRYDKHPYFL